MKKCKHFEFFLRFFLFLSPKPLFFSFFKKDLKNPLEIPQILIIIVFVEICVFRNGGL